MSQTTMVRNLISAMRNLRRIRHKIMKMCVLLIILCLTGYSNVAQQDKYSEGNFLVIHPNGGLCNQLFGIANGLVIATLTNRSLIIGGFKPNFDSDFRVPASQIYDCYSMEQILTKMALQRIKIFCVKDDFPNDKYVFKHNHQFRGEEVVLKLQQISNYSSVDIGNPFLMYFRSSYSRFQGLFLRYVTFNKSYFDEATNLLKTVETSYKNSSHNIVAIHLRLENDILYHLHREINVGLKHFLNDSMKSAHIANNGTSMEALNVYMQQEFTRVLDEIPHSKVIYICSGLLSKFMNQINDAFLKSIMTTYPRVFVQIRTDEKLDREINAVRDLAFIKQDVSYFIGVDHSTFSITATEQIGHGYSRLLRFFN